MTIDSPAEHPLSSQLLQHEGFVRRLAARLVGEASAAEDVAQDALTLALQRERWEPGGLRAWLAGTVRRLARHRGRGEMRRRWREAAAARSETASVSEPLEEQQRVVEAVLALEEPFRETVLLTHYHGLSPAAIARRNGVPAATVRTRLHRAHEKLRGKLIAAHGGDRRAWLSALAPLLSTERTAAPPATGLGSGSAVWGLSSIPVPVSAFLGGLVVAASAGLCILRSATEADPEPMTTPVAEGVPARSKSTPLQQERERPRETARRPVQVEPATGSEARRLAYWEAVRDARAERKHFVDAFPEKAPDAALRRSTHATMISPVILYAHKDLRLVADRLGTRANLPIGVTPAAQKAASECGLHVDFAFHEPHSLAAMLDLLVFLARGEVGWAIVDGQIRLCAPEELVDRQIKFTHFIADLLLDPRDYFSEEDEIRPIFEEPIDVDNLATMLQENISPGRWEQTGVYIENTAERLTVQHDRDVHEKVEVFLDRMRSFLVPLPEEGRPGVQQTLDASAPNRRVSGFLAETPLGLLLSADEPDIRLEELLVRASRVGGFDYLLMYDDRDPLPTIPQGSSSLAQALDALREEGTIWALCHGIVILFPDFSYNAPRPAVLRDIRDLLTEATIPAPRLIGHPALEHYAAESELPFTLTDDCIDITIRAHIDPESWDHDPGNCLMIMDGILILNQSPAVVAEVDRLLEVLRTLGG